MAGRVQGSPQGDHGRADLTIVIELKELIAHHLALGVEDLLVDARQRPGEPSSLELKKRAQRLAGSNLEVGGEVVVRGGIAGASSGEIERGGKLQLAVRLGTEGEVLNEVGEAL